MGIKKRLFSPGTILIFLILVGLGLHLLAVHTREMIRLDETVYARMAQNLDHGAGLEDITGLSSTTWTPLFPVFIAGLSWLLGNVVISGYIINIVFGALVLVPMYLLGRDMFGAGIGLRAALILLVLPDLVDYSSKLYSEDVFTFFLLMAIVFAWRLLQRPSMLLGALTGVSLGLAYLTNPESVYYLVAMGGLILGVAWWRHDWRPFLKALAVFAGLFVLLASPYVIFLHRELGQWTYSGKSYSDPVYAAMHGWTSPAGWEKGAMALAPDGREVMLVHLIETNQMNVPLISSSRAHLFYQEVKGFVKSNLYRVFPLVLLPLLAIGLFAGGRNRRHLRKVGFTLVMAGPVVAIFGAYINERFFIPYLPLGVLWAAVGWSRVEAWILKGIRAMPRGVLKVWSLRLAPFLLGAVIMLAILPVTGGVVMAQSYVTGYKDAGLWLHDHGGSGKGIMSSHYSPAFYSGGESVSLPYAGYGPLTYYARVNHVSYFVISRAELHDRPELAGFLQGGAGNPDWALVHESDQGTSQDTLIFQLRGSGSLSR